MNINLIKGHFNNFINELNCKLCNQIVNNPCTLDCGHFFCRECIINPLKVAESINCGICNYLTKCKDVKSSHLLNNILLSYKSIYNKLFIQSNDNLINNSQEIDNNESKSVSSSNSDCTSQYSYHNEQVINQDISDEYYCNDNDYYELTSINENSNFAIDKNASTTILNDSKTIKGNDNLSITNNKRENSINDEDSDDWIENYCLTQTNSYRHLKKSNDSDNHNNLTVANGNGKKIVEPSIVIDLTQYNDNNSMETSDSANNLTANYTIYQPQETVDINIDQIMNETMEFQISDILSSNDTNSNKSTHNNSPKDNNIDNQIDRIDSNEINNVGEIVLNIYASPTDSTHIEAHDKVNNLIYNEDNKPNKIRRISTFEPKPFILYDSMTFNEDDSHDSVSLSDNHQIDLPNNNLIDLTKNDDNTTMDNLNQVHNQPSIDENTAASIEFKNNYIDTIDANSSTQISHYISNSFINKDIEFFEPYIDINCDVSNVDNKSTRLNSTLNNTNNCSTQPSDQISSYMINKNISFIETQLDSSSVDLSDITAVNGKITPETFTFPISMNESDSCRDIIESMYKKSKLVSSAIQSTLKKQEKVIVNDNMKHDVINELNNKILTKFPSIYSNNRESKDTTASLTNTEIVKDYINTLVQTVPVVLSTKNESSSNNSDVIDIYDEIDNSNKSSQPNPVCISSAGKISYDTENIIKLCESKNWVRYETSLECDNNNIIVIMEVHQIKLNYKLVKKTTRYVKALGYGCWIVDSNWLNESIKSGKLLVNDLNKYEIAGTISDTIVGGPKRARVGDIQAGANILLSNYIFYILTIFDDTPYFSKDEIVWLINRYGGKVIDTLSYNENHSSAFMILSMKRKPNKFSLSSTITNKTEIRIGSSENQPVYYINWLVDCICCQMIPTNKDSYKII